MLTTTLHHCIENLYPSKLYPGLIIVRIRPVAMELDDVRVLQPGEVVEHHLYLVLLRLEVLPLGELHLVPDHLHALLRVHGEVRAVDAGHIALFHLEQRNMDFKTFDDF